MCTINLKFVSITQNYDGQLFLAIDLVYTTAKSMARNVSNDEVAAVSNPQHYDWCINNIVISVLILPGTGSTRATTRSTRRRSVERRMQKNRYDFTQTCTTVVRVLLYSMYSMCCLSLR